MPSDDSTLVEPLATRLLRASYAADDASATLLAENAGTGDIRNRILALRGLSRRGLLEDAVWRNALEDSDVEIRREILLLLAHADIDDSDVFNLVRALLHDTDDLVVEAAIFVLGEHLVVDAVDELCVIAAAHNDARCRESAIASLGAIGDDRARETIIRALDDKPPVRRRAIVALANYEGPDIDAALATAAEDKDWQVRAAVTQLQNQED